MAPGWEHRPHIQKAAYRLRMAVYGVSPPRDPLELFYVKLMHLMITAPETELRRLHMGFPHEGEVHAEWVKARDAGEEDAFWQRVDVTQLDT
jgi:hypothetical protein